MLESHKEHLPIRYNIEPACVFTTSSISADYRTWGLDGKGQKNMGVYYKVLNLLTRKCVRFVVERAHA